MWKDINALEGSKRQRTLIITALIAGIAAFFVSYMFAVLDVNDALRTGLVSDINSYRDLADSLLAGAIPYVDAPFEHLPAMVVPILGLGWLSEISGTPLWLVWPVAMTGVFAATAALVDRIDPQHPAGFTFVAVSLPLLPLALFRLEPWVVLFAVGAIVAFLAGRNVLGVAATVIGSLAKAWPIVVSMLPWKTGSRPAAAWALMGSGVGIAMIALQEGFRTGRDFEGIHTETVVGSIVLFTRHMSGSALETLGAAGARYISVPTWAVLLNALPGLLVLGVALTVLRGPVTRQTTVSIVGLTVLGVVLVSPLFSTQFLIWLGPFVAALSYRNRLLYVVAGVFALASVAVFEPDTLVWSIEVLASNVVVLALAFTWSRDLIIATREAQPPNTSLRNLPV